MRNLPRFSGVFWCLRNFASKGYGGCWTPHLQSLVDCYRWSRVEEIFWSSACLRPARIVFCKSLVRNRFVRWWERCKLSICTQRLSIQLLSFSWFFSWQVPCSHECDPKKIARAGFGRHGHRTVPTHKVMSTQTSFELLFFYIHCPCFIKHWG